MESTGVERYATADLEALVSTGGGSAMARSIWPDFDEQRDEILARRSAIRWPERLVLPLLLMHGSDDESVSPVQTLRLATELANARTEFGMIIFPSGDHNLTQQRVTRDEHAVDFFGLEVVRHSSLSYG